MSTAKIEHSTQKEGIYQMKVPSRSISIPQGQETWTDRQSPVASIAISFRIYELTNSSNYNTQDTTNLFAQS